MHVVHVVLELEGGGLESMVAGLVRASEGTGIDVSVVTVTGRPGQLAERLRPRLRELRSIRFTPVVSFVYPAALVEVLRELRPDVVHIHNGTWLKGALASRLAGGIPVVYTEHGREHHDPPTSRMVDAIAARLTTRILPVSERLATYLPKAIFVARSTLEVVPNGVDTTRFAPAVDRAALRRAHGLPAEAFVVGSVGRLEPVKNYALLLDAVAALGPDAAQVQLLLVGEGSERAALEAQAARLGVRAMFPGWATDPLPFYQMLDAFALVSRSEGLSVALLEAMSTGCIPLVTDVGSNRQVVGAELADLVLAHPAADAGAARLRALMGAPTERARRSALARERVVSGFSLAATARRYQEIYGEVTAGHRWGMR